MSAEKLIPVRAVMYLTVAEYEEMMRLVVAAALVGDTSLLTELAANALADGEYRYNEIKAGG